MTTILPAAVAGTITRACSQCRRSLSGRRPDAVFCSDTCSKRFRRGTALEAAKARTSIEPQGETNPAPVRASSASGRLSGLLAGLQDEAPGYIESAHTRRVYPRTYAEHGMTLPDYLRVA